MWNDKKYLAEEYVTNLTTGSAILYLVQACDGKIHTRIK